MTLFEKCSNLKNELSKCHELLLECIESQSRCSKIDTYIEKCDNYLELAVEVSDELIYLTANSANADELIPVQDIWLHKMTQSNNKILQQAITYKTSFEAVTEPENMDSSSKTLILPKKSQSHKTDTRSKMSHRSSRHQQSGSQKSSRYTAAPSKTPSEKKRNLMLLKKQQEELERQAKVSL